MDLFASQLHKIVIIKYHFHISSLCIRSQSLSHCSLVQVCVHAILPRPTCGITLGMFLLLHQVSILTYIKRLDMEEIQSFFSGLGWSKSTRHLLRGTVRVLMLHFGHQTFYWCWLFLCNLIGILRDIIVFVTILNCIDSIQLQFEF